VRQPPGRPPHPAPAAPPMRRAHHTPRPSSPTRRPPEHASARPPIPRRRSRKGLIFTTVLLAVGAGGWVALTRGAPRTASLLAAPIRAEAAAIVHEPAAAQPARNDSLAPETHSAAGVSTPALPKAEHHSTRQSPALRDSSAPKSEAKPKQEEELSAPSIPSPVDVDAVTRSIDQSTKAKVDSVQKPRIDDKAPIFKKP
jgi:hypothetical protein